MAPKHKAAPESDEPSKRARARQPGASTTSPIRRRCFREATRCFREATRCFLDADVDVNRVVPIITSMILYVKYDLSRYDSKTALLSYERVLSRKHRGILLLLASATSHDDHRVITFPASPEEETVAGENPMWAMVDEMANLFRIRAPTPGDAGGVARAMVDEMASLFRMRIVFPVSLCVWAKKAADLAGDTFPGTLCAVTGHASIYGSEALEDGPGSWVAAL